MIPTPVLRPTIPYCSTPLIGRGDELSTIHDLFFNKHARLVTLTGPPGVGKTRLALEFASHIAQDRDSFAFVDLAPLVDTRLLPSRILTALGIREHGGDVLAQLLQVLKNRPAFLLLDNFEHLSDGASLVAEIINFCPKARVLVTSRTSLRLRSEHRLTIPPLSLPGAQIPSSEEEFLSIPSVALFVERAQAADAAFRPSLPHDADAIAGICSRLDGLPLAIEIAAAQTQFIPVGDIWERLKGRWGPEALRMLTGPVTDLPARHRTLFQAIAWSYQLLSASVQTLFRRLAIFPGGFDIDAVRGVCLDENVELDPEAGANTLIGHHLVERESSDGSPRYRLLQTIREFAAALLLESDEGERLHRRHAEYYLAFAEQGEPNFWGPGQTIWLQRLERELDNLRAALDWSLGDSQQHDIAERFGGALYRLWDLGGHWDEGARYIDRLIALPTVPSSNSIRTLNIGGYFAFVRADYQRALELIKKCSAQAELLGDQWGRAYSRIGLGCVRISQGDLTGGGAALQEAARIGSEHGVPGALPAALQFLGVAAALRGDPEEADLVTQRALAAAREMGSPQMIHQTLFLRGLALLTTTRVHYSIQAFQESLTIAVNMQERLMIAMALEGVGWAAIALGAGEVAAKIMAGAEALRERLGALESNIPGSQIYRRAAVERARRLLGEPAFADAWAAGNVLSLSALIALALTSRAEFSREATRVRERRGNLSRREVEIVAEIAEGLTNAQIAAKFSIGTRTVDYHVQNILNKLTLYSRTQVAVWAVEHGFTKLTKPSA